MMPRKEHPHIVFMFQYKTGLHIKRLGAKKGLWIYTFKGKQNNRLNVNGYGFRPYLQDTKQQACAKFRILELASIQFRNWN